MVKKLKFVDKLFFVFFLLFPSNLEASISKGNNLGDFIETINLKFDRP